MIGPQTLRLNWKLTLVTCTNVHQTQIGVSRNFIHRHHHHLPCGQNDPSCLQLLQSWWLTTPLRHCLCSNPSLFRGMRGRVWVKAKVRVSHELLAWAEVIQNQKAWTSSGASRRSWPSWELMCKVDNACMSACACWVTLPYWNMPRQTHHWVLTF